MLTPHVFGLNYQCAEFGLREKIAFSQEEIVLTLDRLKNSGITKEIFILSTCNRTEIYCVTNDADFVINAICDIQGICPRELKKHSYLYSGIDCANHLFRVVCGLESMVLGETEIVAQVKQAVNLAKEHGTISTNLIGIYEMALALEKDIRNKTKINHISISMGSAIVNLVTQTIPDYMVHNILFIGAGQLMNQVAPHFKHFKFAKKTIINRTLANAINLAKKIDAEAMSLINIPEIISDYSIIIASCSISAPILTEELFRKRADKKTLIIDLSMPLIVDQKIRQNKNIKMLTIDDVAKIVDVGIEKRRIVALEAQTLIDSKLLEYQNWLKKRELSPVIKALRDNAELIRQEVLSAAEKQLQSGATAKEVLQNLSLKLTNKLLHQPTVNLCATTNKLQNDLTDLVKYLYDLK